jgi:hypothetical protein
MRSVRFSIAGLMIAVAAAAFGSAALRSPTAAWAGAMLILVCGVLALAIVGALCRKGSERAWWLGFAICGAGYLVLAFWSDNNFQTLPTTTLLSLLGSKFDESIVQNAIRGGAGSPQWRFLQIGHCLWSLLAAAVGGLLALLLFAGPVPDREPAHADIHQKSASPPKSWRRPAIIWLGGLALVAMAALAGSHGAPGLWAGAIFFLTCALLGLAVLGASFGRGGRRTIWVGAALFGCGYMYLTFARSTDTWPYPPTTHLLNALRPGPRPYWSGFPDASDRFNALNARLLNVLEQPIPMHFPNGAPLEDVLKHIKTEAEARVGKPIPIYVYPAGLQSARQTLSSTVRIDLEGAALKNSLRRCLKQLDLSYLVRDGFLMITESGSPLPVYEDPFLIVGHCLIALIAAGLGGALALFVSDARSRTSADQGTRAPRDSRET